MLPVPSHYLASFDYARFWQEKGYDIVYTTLPGSDQLVHFEGFKSIAFRYSYETRIESFRVFWGTLMKSMLDKSWMRTRYRTFFRTCLELDKIVRELNPVKIMLDEHLSDYYFFLYSREMEIEILNTKLSTRKSINSPPLDSSFIPDRSLWSKLRCYMIWQSRVVKIRTRYLIEFVAFMQRDESYFQKRIARRSGLDFSETVDFGRSLYRGIKNVKTVVLAPNYLEYPTNGNCDDEMYFFRNEKYSISDFYRNNDYNELLASIELFKNSSHVKIIYCCFGTLQINNYKMQAMVLPGLIEFAKNNSDVYVVICMPPAKIINLPNVFVLPKLPQPHFLQYVDLMIGHGGLGSIKDCILAGVSMLLCPTNTRYDQVGNASRIEALGLGLASNVALYGDKNFSKKINTLLFETAFEKEKYLLPPS